MKTHDRSACGKGRAKKDGVADELKWRFLSGSSYTDRDILCENLKDPENAPQEGGFLREQDRKNEYAADMELSKCARAYRSDDAAYGYYYSYNPQNPNESDGALRLANIKIQKNINLDGETRSRVRVLKGGIYKINYSVRMSSACFAVLRLIIIREAAKCISSGSVTPIFCDCNVSAAIIECLKPGDAVYLSVCGSCADEEEKSKRVVLSNVYLCLDLIDS